MSNFTPAAFVPSSALEILHGSSRVQGGNVLVLPEDGSFALTGSDETSQYFIGVAAGPIVMIVMFVVWMFALCCVGCCKRRVSCGNKPAIILFVGFMVLSCFGWFYSIGGNAQTTAGVDKIFNLGDELNTLVDNARDDIVAGLSVAENVIDSTAALATTCNVPGFPPGLNVSDAIPDIDSALISGIQPQLDDLIASVREFTDAYNDATDTARPYLEQWQTAYVVLVASIIGLIGIFTLATIWRVWEGAPGQSSKFAACLGKSSSWIFFSFGILLLLLIWIVIALLAVISTVGADLCLPSPSANVIRVASQLTADSRGGNVTGFCDEIPYSYTCYFTTCVGANPVEDIRGDIANVVDDQVLDTLNILVANVTDYITLLGPDPAADACLEALTNTVGNVTEIPARLDDALGIVSCEQIQPFYAGIVEEGLCNGVAAGMATTWITMALGATALMAAMFVYRLFDFDKYQQGQMVTAEVVAEGGQSNPKYV